MSVLGASGLRCRPAAPAAGSLAGPLPVPAHLRTALRIRPEDDGHETVSLDRRLRAPLATRLFPDPPDSRSRLLDETDPMEQIGQERIPPDAPSSQLRLRHTGRQPSRTDDFDAVRIDLHEDIRALEKPVPVHDGVRDRLPHGGHRILPDLFAPQVLDPVGRARVSLHEAHRLLDVVNDPAVEVAPVHDADLLRSPSQQAGDVRIGEETARLPSEEEHAGVTKQQFRSVAFRRFDVHQHIFDCGVAGDTGQPKPPLELVAVEILGILEPGTRRQVEPNGPFRPEEVPDFLPAEFLGHRALPSEEPVGALHRLVRALPHPRHDDAPDGLHDELHRRIAIPRDVLNARPKGIRVPDSDDRPVVRHTEQHPPADGVGERHELTRHRLGEPLLELERRPLPLLEEDGQVGLVHDVPSAPAPAPLRGLSPPAARPARKATANATDFLRCSSAPRRPSVEHPRRSGELQQRGKCLCVRGLVEVALIGPHLPRSAFRPPLTPANGPRPRSLIRTSTVLSP